VRELTLQVAAGDVDEVLDAVLPALPGGLHMREEDGQVELAMLDSPGAPTAEELRRLAGPRLIELRTAEVSDDWRERRLGRYRPLVVAERFLVRPEWAPPSESRDLIEIVLEQTAAFGTGVHPTTQACLATLADMDPGGSLTDIGCGSGVLSIAAARLGWSPVVAVDIDPNSVAAAGRNAERSGVPIDVRRLDVTTEPPPESATLIANVPPAVQIGLAERLPRAPSTLVASGFKPEEIAAVGSAWEELGLRVADEVLANEWSLLVMRP
jgi:ribosomal protein L11 methyltransferase